MCHDLRYGEYASACKAPPLELGVALVISWMVGTRGSRVRVVLCLLESAFVIGESADDRAGRPYQSRHNIIDHFAEHIGQAAVD